MPTNRGDLPKIIFAVVALVVAAGVIFWFYKKQQPYEVGHWEQPPGSNPKIQAMKAMKNGQQPDENQKPSDPNSLGDR